MAIPKAKAKRTDKNAKRSKIKLTSKRMVVHRNMRQLLARKGIERSSRGVGVGIYDNFSVPLLEQIIPLAMWFTQQQGRKTVRHDAMEKAIDLVMSNQVAGYDLSQDIQYKDGKKKRAVTECA